MKEEFYDITFRKKVYRNVEELQQNVDAWIQSYNTLRPHSGRYCYGKTPMQTFTEAKPLALEKQLDNLVELRENKVELAMGDNAHIEALPHLDSIAPSTEIESGFSYQGAKPSEVKIEPHLTDNNTV